MKRTVEFKPAAQTEIEVAFAWYEAQRTGLGAEYLRAIATARDQLAHSAERYPVTRGTFRWIKLRRFPYALHFDLDADNVRVHACLHFRQSPTRWPGA